MRILPRVTALPLAGGGGAMPFNTTHPGPWAAGVEERIISKVRELDRGLR